ncbi:MAG: hypothetical protein LAT51_10100 [Flavobacteriaceae bacterium]|nr:hypothetical protein [Flavobacteriaceae bacterium]
MKKILIYLSLIVAFASCKSTKEIKENQMTFEGCPEGGECEFEVIENTRVFMAGDDQMGYFPKLEDSKSVHTIKITYTKDTMENIMDDEYIEVFYFTIGNQENTIDLVDTDLQKADLIYGRICACRGQTGYEKINQGKLLVELKDQNQYIQLQAKPKKYPILMSEVEINQNK